MYCRFFNGWKRMYIYPITHISQIKEIELPPIYLSNLLFK